MVLLIASGAPLRVSKTESRLQLAQQTWNHVTKKRAR